MVAEQYFNQSRYSCRECALLYNDEGLEQGACSLMGSPMCEMCTEMSEGYPVIRDEDLQRILKGLQQ